MDIVKRYLTEFEDDGVIYTIKDPNTYTKEELNEKIATDISTNLTAKLDDYATKDYVKSQVSNVSESIDRINEISKELAGYPTKEYVETYVKEYVSEYVKTLDITTTSVITELKSSIETLTNKISALEAENKELKTLIEKNTNDIDYYHNDISFVDNETGEEYDVVLVDNNGVEYDFDNSSTTSCCNCNK